MIDVVITQEERVRRMKQLGMNKPIGYIKAQENGIDCDYIPGKDDGEHIEKEYGVYEGEISDEELSNLL